MSDHIAVATREDRAGHTDASQDGLQVYQLDPLTDPRWMALVRQHPLGGIFHSTGWLRSLQQTYGYRVLALTTTPAGEPLRDGVVFCEVDSWLTGRRLVSLPFSDHCDPLLHSSATGHVLVEALRKKMSAQHLRYIELRPCAAAEEWEAAEKMLPGEPFALHTVSLERPLDQLYRSLHKSCIQSKVARAEREALTYEVGRSRRLMEQFFQLMLLTRRRHGVPPQPIAWFHNLADNLGEALSVHLAAKDGQPVAALLTLDCKDTITYKYGCSDERFGALGGTPYLFWKVIEGAHQKGLRVLDLGRTDLDNQGLLDFKRRLGGVMQTLTYYRLSERAPAQRKPSRLAPLLHRAVELAPSRLLAMAGKVLYRHAG